MAQWFGISLIGKYNLAILIYFDSTTTRIWSKSEERGSLYKKTKYNNIQLGHGHPHLTLAAKLWSGILGAPPTFLERKRAHVIGLVDRTDTNTTKATNHKNIHKLLGHNEHKKTKFTPQQQEYGGFLLGKLMFLLQILQMIIVHNLPIAIAFLFFLKKRMEMNLKILLAALICVPDEHFLFALILLLQDDRLLSAIVLCGSLMQFVTKVSSTSCY
ncbi:hypothetical protein ACJX0J_029766 [Zea mays]